MTDTLDQIETSELPGVVTDWVTDAELIRRSGIPEKKLRPILRALDANPRSGFPRKDAFWGDRRHYPSVQDYWKNEQRRRIEASQMRRAS